MTNWKEVKLESIADVIMGQSPKSEYYNAVGDGLPFLQGNRTFGLKYPIFDTYTTSPTKIAQPQDVIMSVRAPVGDLNITPVKMCLGRGVCAMRMKNGNQEFLYYLMKHNVQNLLNRESGTVFGSVNRNDIGSLEVLVPENDKIQQKVASVLSLLDAKIETNTRINNNLEQQAQALFKSWFVDKEYEVERETTLGVVCKCELGGTPSRIKSEYWGGNIAWINSGEVNNFRITKASEYITEIGLKHSATKLLPRKTTVLAITGATLGQISLLEIDSCTNQSVVGVLENETLPYEFIYPYICYNIKELLSHQTGGAQQHINKQNVEQLTLSLPKSTLIKDYKNIVAPIFELIAKNCFESERLAAIRDALLPKLMSGEIDVSNVDISALTSTDKLSFTED